MMLPGDSLREPIFVINAGSSSIKFSLFQTASDRSVEAGAHGQVEGIGTSPRLKVADVRGRILADQLVAGKDYAAAIAEIHAWFRKYVGSEAALHGIGHRVVHGGSHLSPTSHYR
jgi:acetate kinase